eukprot:5928691-Pleurochrysis_carterae.AAC.2
MPRLSFARGAHLAPHKLERADLRFGALFRLLMLRAMASALSVAYKATPLSEDEVRSQGYVTRSLELCSLSLSKPRQHCRDGKKMQRIIASEQREANGSALLHTLMGPVSIK